MKPVIRDPAVLARMRTTFDLCAAAEIMMLQNLRRWHPDETDEQIRERHRRWLLKMDEPIEDPTGTLRPREDFPWS